MSRRLCNILPAVLLFCLPASGPAKAQIDLSGLGFDGFSVAARTVTVAALESGRLDRLDVKVGARVSEGQVIGVLDDSLQQVGVEAARAMAEMRGTVEAAEADHRAHAVRLEQLQTLQQQGVARPEEVIRAQAEYEVAAARALSAKEELAVRAIELQRAEEQLRRRQIVAPIPGTVVKVFCVPGEFVSPNDPSIVTIVDTGQLIGEFNVPAHEARKFTIGGRVKVNVMSQASPLSGIVEMISPVIDGESGTRKIEVTVENKSGALLAGDRWILLPPSPKDSSRVPTRSADLNPLRFDQPARR